MYSYICIVFIVGIMPDVYKNVSRSLAGLHPPGASSGPILVQPAGNRHSQCERNWPDDRSLEYTGREARSNESAPLIGPAPDHVVIDLRRCPQARCRGPVNRAAIKGR